MFRSKFSEDIFKLKYAHEGCETWASLCETLVEDVMGATHYHASYVLPYWAEEMEYLGQIGHHKFYVE